MVKAARPNRRQAANMLTSSISPTSLPQRVLRRIHDWQERRRGLRELARCDSRERQRVVQELGVTEAELEEAIRAGAEPNPLLGRMLKALHVDYPLLVLDDPRIAWDLRRVCALCPNWRRCRRELDAATAAGNFQGFCYNATTLKAIADDPRYGRHEQ